MRHIILQRWPGLPPYRTGMAVVFMLLVGACGAGAEVVEYDLTIAKEQVNFTGRAVEAITINGGIPGPVLTFREGDVARVRVHNKMDVATSVHWHGILLPNDQDGVPYLTTLPIKANRTHTFEYPLIQSGTYWYHSHTGLQEQRGVYGAIVIHPKKEDPMRTADREAVVVLSDWTDQNPHEVLRMLKRGSEYYSFKKGSMLSLAGAIENGGLGAVIGQGLERMPPMDISDVGYDRFLSNGLEEAAIEARAGETVRVRVVNAGASTYFYLEYAGGPVRVIAADGLDVEPVEVDRLLMGVAETYDLLLTVPEGGGSMELRATAQDGSGHTSTFVGTGKRVLAADVPGPDPYMSHAMHSGGGDGEQMDHGSMHGHTTAANPRPGAPYAKLRSPQATTLPEGRPERTIRLNVTGDMERYVWSFNGKTLAEADKILIRKGENVRIELDNKTMMHHPIHLHGHFFRVLNGQGERSPLKHTVDVPPLGKVTIEFAATEEKDWFLHCHVLYHMKAGMARVVHYEGSEVDADLAAARMEAGNPLRDDPWYFWGTSVFLTQMTEGQIVLANTRGTFTLDREVAWDRDEEDRYEFTLTYDRHLDRFASVFVGGVTSEEQDTRGVAGFRYVLPMNIDSAVWVDTEGEVRAMVEHEVQLTDRLAAFADGQYDTESGWESVVGARYLLDRGLNLVVQHHSEFGFGGGVSLDF